MLLSKDLISVKMIRKEEIEDLFYTANSLKKQGLRDADILKGNMTTLFYENSTRTKHSFTMAGQNMGLHVADLQVETSSIHKGESLEDTAVTIDQMGVDILVVRHKNAGVAEYIAKKCKASIINAGDGQNEHPSQALLDAFTMWEYFGGIKGLRICIIGDIIHSRVAKSNLYLLKQLGAEIIFCGPPNLVSKEFDTLGAKVILNPNVAVKNADIVMGLRIQNERQSQGIDVREYNRFFGIHEATLALAKKDVQIMHPGPINWGVELDLDLMQSHSSLIQQQVHNGLYVRMAIIQKMIEYRRKIKRIA